MWLVRLALDRPYTFAVMALGILLGGVLAVTRMPKDVFPQIAEPIVTLIWQYVGIPAEDFGKNVTLASEQSISSTVANVRRIESTTVYGKDVIRIAFQPGVRIDQAVSQITAVSQTIIRRMLPGQTPPQIVQYDASSVPILQLALGSDRLSESELYDFGNYEIREEIASVPGAIPPLPYGGRPRLIMIDADAQRMHARGVTVREINEALLRQNVNLPTGSTQIGDREYILGINNSPDHIAELGDVPVRMTAQGPITIRDVADVRDGYNEQTNLVRHDGRKSVLLTILKSGAASSLDIIREIKRRIATMKLKDDLKVSVLFDQSVFVVNAMRAVVTEGAIAAGLTGLLILLFLGSWRSTLVVVTVIPLAILASIIGLYTLGYSLNLMTLGGLALAVGILVDDATVVIENVHRHLAMDHDLEDAIFYGAQQIVVPAFVSMVCICIVFLPVLALEGAARYLFAPMALAVVFAIAASFLFGQTLVPVMVRTILRGEAAHGTSTGVGARLHARVEAAFEALRTAYLGALGAVLRMGTAVVLGFVALLGATAVVIGQVGQDFFPVVDAGQIRLHVNAPIGTRIEETAVWFSRVEEAIRRLVAPSDLDVIIDNIGIPPSTNLAYSDNVTLSSADGEILVSLVPEHGTGTPEYVRRLRRELPRAFPELAFHFQPGDMMNQILNFGVPAPIDVRVIGSDKGNYRLARAIEAGLARVPGAVDVHLHQIMNQPALRLEVDRVRAAQMGITQREVAEDYLISSSSSVVVTPTYWNDPKSGRNYQVVVVQPHERLDSVDALLGIPLPGRGQAQSQTIGNVASLRHVEVPAVVTHVDLKNTFDIYANVQDRDLGSVVAGVRAVLDTFRDKLPKGTRLEVAGQAQSMDDAFQRLAFGLVAAVVLVYLAMVVNFQSWSDPFIVISALPAAFCGIVWMLLATHTTFSVPSLMGAIMSVGVATANSILMTSFAREQLRSGVDAREAALRAGAARLRPVLMTAFAMVAGMLPMASGLGEGGEQNAPLGRAVIGGLLLATLATLFFVPMVFSWMHGRGTGPAGTPPAPEPVAA